MPELVSAQDDALVSSTRLKITEIFYSLQGEANTVGWPTVFVRLTGCPLRCQYCDTAYAFSGGDWMEIDEIVETVSQYATPYITVTGGESLAQKNCLPLLTSLCDAGYQVSLETSGAFSIADVDARVSKVIDIKTPASKESQRNDFSNVGLVSVNDQFKFVICDRNDFDWAVSIVEKYQLLDKATVLFSPSHQQLEAKQLADWILAEKLPVRMQIQLHKYLWGDKPGV